MVAGTSRISARNGCGLPFRLTAAWICLAKAKISVAAPTRNGTKSRNVRSVVTRRSTAPIAAPISDSKMTITNRRSSFGRRSRSASAAIKWPGVTATAFEALATTGGMPLASIAGNVISVAPPAIALATPPISPAPASSAMVPMSTGLTSGRFRLLHLHAAAFGEHHLVEQLHQRVDRLDRRRRRVGELRHFEDRADQRLGFERAAGLHVLQHRGLVGADGLRAGDALVDGDAKDDAELLGDVLRLFHHGRREFARLGELADVDEGGVGERRDRIEGEIAPGFEPDFGANVLQHTRLEACFDENIVQLFHP